MRNRLVMMVGVVVACGSLAGAAVVFDVDFETGYVPGGLVGQSGGIMGDGTDDVWLSGGASSNLTTVQSAVAMDTYAVETYRSGFGGAQARFAQRINYLAETKTVYSFAMYAGEDISKGDVYIINHLSGQRALGAGRSDNGFFRYAYQPAGSATQYVETAISIVPDAWYWVQFDIRDAGPTDKLDIWLWEEGHYPMGGWTLVADDLDYAPGNGQQTTLSIDPQGSGIGYVMYFDAFFAATGDDAVFIPEPTSLALLMSLVGLIGLRRRR